MGNNLTPQQEEFCVQYCISGVGYQAAKNAGYSGQYSALASVASKNLRKPKIQKRIKEIMEAELMSKTEALHRLGRIARAEYSIAINDNATVDLKLLKQLGLMHLVKGISPTRYGNRIEFYDAQAALTHILKIHDAIGDISTDEPIKVIQINVPS